MSVKCVKRQLLTNTFAISTLQNVSVEFRVHNLKYMYVYNTYNIIFTVSAFGCVSMTKRDVCVSVSLT